MKKTGLLIALFVLPLLALAQDNVPAVDMKKPKEKGKPTNNPEIKKSKKEMAKEMNEWDKKKYKKEVGHKHKNKEKEQEEKKKESNG